MTWGMTAVAGATLVSGYMGSKAAKSAAGTQADAAAYAADVNKEMFDVQNEQFAPYRGAGYQGLNILRSMLPGAYTKYDESGKAIEGTQTGTDYLTRPFGAEDLKTYLDPSMEFRMRYGQEGTNRLANLGGGAISGNTLRALTDYSQNLASTEYGKAFDRKQTDVGNIYNRLASIAGIGQSAQGTTAGLAANTANTLGNLAVGSANAQAAGTIGSTNAITGAVQNLGNTYMLGNLLRPNAVNTGVNYPGYGGAGSVGNLTIPSVA